MEQKVVKFLSLLAIGMMGLCIAVLVAFPRFHESSLALRERIGEDTGISVLSLLKDNSQLLTLTDDYTMLREHQLRLGLPGEVGLEDIEMTSNYMAHEISLSIPGIGSTYFYDYPMIGTSDGIEDLRYDVDDHVGRIDILTDHVRECVMTVDGNFLYLDFKKPSEVYDHLVVIDAGHGGNAPGANQGDVLEKNINLAIVEKIKQLFDKDDHNLGVYYTRLDDSNPSFESRVGIANDIKADAFVSVHINSTDSGRMSGIHGTSVLYLVADKSQQSMNLAELCLNNLLAELGSDSKGLVAGDEIYIIRTSKVPVALCEIGFITNPEEKALMLTDDYQERAARGIYKAILQKIGIKEEEHE